MALNEIVSTESWSFSSNRGDFSPEYAMYQWELLQSGWEQDNMQELTCVVTFQVQGKEHQIQLSTLVEDALENGLQIAEVPSDPIQKGCRAFTLLEC